MSSSSFQQQQGTDEQRSRHPLPQPLQDVDHVDDRDVDYIWSPIRTEIPSSGLEFSFDGLDESDKSSQDKLEKRASNVVKLTQENEKLKAELKAMTDRLEAAENRRKELESQRSRR